MCTIEVRARDAARVYVDVPGTLDEIMVRPGDRVALGDPLAQLASVDVDLEIARLGGELAQYEIQLENRRRQRFLDPQAGADIQQLSKARDTLQDQLEQQKADRERLRLVAPIAGTVMPPPWRPHRETADGQLPSWSGTPLQRKNLGVPLEEGVFCLVGDPKEMEVVLYIDQGDIEFVVKGQEVEIKLEELPHEVFWTEIEEIAPSHSQASSQRLSTKAGGEMPTETDPSGVERPTSTTYEALAPLDDPDGLLRLGLRGRAKIHTRWQTVGKRLWRFANQLINFKL
jgi:putative peptide zinc metalloprotease protein